MAHVGGALATGGRSDDAAAHAAQQALWAEWFELYAEVAAARRTTEAREETRSMAAAPPHQKYAATNGGGGENDGGVVDAVSAVVVGAMPSLLGCVWAALRSPPPPDLYDDADGVIGLKTALVMLAQLKPTHATPAGATVRGPLGDALRGALDAPAAAAAAGGGGESAGGLVLRELLVGLSTWMPSWLIGEAAAACWELHRHHGDHFARWLCEAMAADGVPRRGLSADQKAAFCEQLVGAANRTAFKAALKHVSGGKKKGSAGSPAR